MYQGLFTIIDWESPLTFEAHPFHRATPSSLATTSVRVTRRVVKVAVPPMRAVRQQVSKGVACSVRWINSGSQAFKKNIKKIEKELATCHFTNWIRSYSCQLWDLWQKKNAISRIRIPKNHRPEDPKSSIWPPPWRSRPWLTPWDLRGLCLGAATT